MVEQAALYLAKSTEYFRLGTMTKDDGSALKFTPNAGISVAMDGERGPINRSVRPSQIKAGQPSSFASPRPLQATVSATKSRSLHLTAIVGSPMGAKGEIIFLIPALAESTVIFVSENEQSANHGDGGSEICIVVTRVIVLCIVISPVSVGLSVTRARKLQQQRQVDGGGEDPLGVSGVVGDPLNRMSWYYSAIAFVGGIKVYSRVRQSLITTPRGSDHGEKPELDRRAVALVWWMIRYIG